jgi:hypothetical protein
MKNQVQLALHFCQSSWQKDTAFVMQKKLFNEVCVNMSSKGSELIFFFWENGELWKFY